MIAEKLIEKRKPAPVIILNILIGLFIYIRIVLQSNIPYYLMASAVYDDGLMIDMAQNLLNGDWLGELNHLTLSKGIAYPLLLAVFNKLMLPYGVGIGIVIVLSSLTAVAAIRPIFNNKYALSLAFLFILYNPVAFSPVACIRIYRDSVMPWGVLFLFSCIIASYIRRHESIKKLIPWQLGSGLSLAFLWLLREDMVWVVPLIAASIIVMLFELPLLKKSGRKIISYILTILMPVLILLASLFLVSAINYAHYGAFMTNDRTKGSITKVGKLIMNIDDGGDPKDSTWVSRKTIELAKQASPTLQGIDLLDEYYGAYSYWEGAELFGDMFYWYFKDVLFSHGNYTDETAFQKDCDIIASELKEGFDKGILKPIGGVSVSSQCRNLFPEDFSESFSVSLKTIPGFLRYENCTRDDFSMAQGNPDEIDKAESVLLTDFTHYSSGRLEKTENAVAAGNKIAKLYSALRVIPFLILIFGFILMVISFIKDIRQKKKFGEADGLFIAVAGLILSSFVNIYATALYIRFFATAFEVFAFHNNSVFIMLALTESMAFLYILKEVSSFIKSKRLQEKKEI